MLERVWTFAHQTAAAVAAFAAARARSVMPVHLPPVQHMQPEPLTLEDRWARATDAVSGAIAGFARIENLHATALSQIDAADYTLQHLLEELSMAMPIVPADGSALRALLATVEEGDVVAAAEQGTLAA
jgi:hypothetical protein